MDKYNWIFILSLIVSWILFLIVTFAFQIDPIYSIGITIVILLSFLISLLYKLIDLLKGKLWNI